MDAEHAEVEVLPGRVSGDLSACSAQTASSSGLRQMFVFSKSSAMVLSDAPSASRMSMAATPVRSLPAEQWKSTGVSPASSARNSSLYALLPKSIRSYMASAIRRPSSGIPSAGSPGLRAKSPPLCRSRGRDRRCAPAARRPARSRASRPLRPAAQIEDKAQAQTVQQLPVSLAGEFPRRDAPVDLAPLDVLALIGLVAAQLAEVVSALKGQLSAGAGCTTAGFAAALDRTGRL